jgi:DNA processing protein
VSLPQGSYDPAVEEGLLKAKQWLGLSPHHNILCLADATYPKLLLDLSDPPLLLFLKGDPACLQPPALAVIGSRSASAQGLENAKAFSRALAQAGYVVVSGLALGIDTAAHQGAILMAPEGSATTMAVIGTGIDRVYPAANRALAQAITERGAILSELPLGAPPLQHHFPRRNRLIAALAKGILVVEAAKHSGSLITARLASEIGRDVFAVPGSIHSPVSKGCHHLIKQGAKLVESGQDIIEELRPQVQSEMGIPIHRKIDLPSGPRLNQQDFFFSQGLPEAPESAGGLPNADPVLQAMGFEPVHFGDLAQRCGLSAQSISQRVLELELIGQISRLDDGRLLQIVEAT